MAKSLRSKRKMRLKTLRREIVEPFYDKKDAAKLAAQEAALAAPKLPVRLPNSTTAMDLAAATTPAAATDAAMDVEMADGRESKALLKPLGGVGKKFKKKFKLKKGKRRGKGKGKIRRKKI